MMRKLVRRTFLLLTFLLLSAIHQAAYSADPVRVGIIGIDNYQSLAFTQVWHKPPEDNPVFGGLKVVAAWKGGSPDIKETLVDIERWAPHLMKQGVTFEDSIDDVLRNCDAVMIMSINGRSHLELAEQALKARKPTYIGRPMAASLEDVIAIFDLAKKYDTPVFSCSQHRSIRDDRAVWIHGSSPRESSPGWRAGTN